MVVIRRSPNRGNGEVLTLPGRGVIPAVARTRGAVAGGLRAIDWLPLPGRSGRFLWVEHRTDLSEHLAQLGGSLTNLLTGVERQSIACFHSTVPLRSEHRESSRDGVVYVGAVLKVRRGQRFSDKRESCGVLSPEQRLCGRKGHERVIDIKDESKQ
jgi:hypothetical protein